MNIAILEDKYADRIEIASYIEGYSVRNAFAWDVETFDTGEALLSAWEKGGYGAAFLDIYLPGLNGMDVARRIREADPACPIVFITVSEEHALESYGLSAQGYVVKPFKPENMEKALAACRHAFEKNSRGIRVMVGGEPINVAADKIRFIEVFRNNTVFHMEHGSVQTRMPLDEVERSLGGEPFLRCHKSYIVNMNYIEKQEQGDLILKDGRVVPIRKNGKREILVALTRYLSGHKDVDAEDIDN